MTPRLFNDYFFRYSYFFRSSTAFSTFSLVRIKVIRRLNIIGSQRYITWSMFISSVCMMFLQSYAPSNISPYFSAIPDTMPINGSEKLVTIITQAPTTGSSVSAAFASSGKTANAPSTNRKPEIVSAGMCLLQVLRRRQMKARDSSD